MSIYAKESDLIAEILAFRASGEMSEFLIRMVYRIADGVRRQFCDDSDPDDFRQECVVLFLKRHENIDVGIGVFNFLTTAFRNHGRQDHRNRKYRERRISEYAIEQGWKPNARNADYYDKLINWNKEHPQEQPPPQIPGERQKYVYQGQPVTVRQLAAMVGLSRHAVWKRLQKSNGDTSKIFGPREKPKGRTGKGTQVKLLC